MTSLLYPTTNLTQVEQLNIVRGEGIYVYDDNGNRYLEGLAALWCSALGYGNEELIDAITTQLKTLPFSHNSPISLKSFLPGGTLSMPQPIRPGNAVPAAAAPAPIAIFFMNLRRVHSFIIPITLPPSLLIFTHPAPPGMRSPHQGL